MYLIRASVNVDSGANKVSDILIWKRQNADDTSAPMANAAKRVVHRFPKFQGQEDAIFDFSVSIPEKSDIWAECVATTSGTECEVDFQYILVKN